MSAAAIRFLPCMDNGAFFIIASLARRRGPFLLSLSLPHSPITQGDVGLRTSSHPLYSPLKNWLHCLLRRADSCLVLNAIHVLPERRKKKRNNFTSHIDREARPPPFPSIKRRVQATSANGDLGLFLWGMGSRNQFKVRRVRL